jgi:hypothetical protein
MIRHLVAGAALVVLLGVASADAFSTRRFELVDMSAAADGSFDGSTGTDNTSVLNALTAGPRLILDCGAGPVKTIKFNGVWRLQNNLDVQFMPSCRLFSALNSPSDGALENPIGTPTLSNVSIKNCWIKRGVTTEGQVLRVNIDGFMFRNCLVEHNYGFAFVVGGNQEIAYNRVVTGPVASTAGTWSVSTTYSTGDIVDHAETTWRALKTTVGVTPSVTATADWRETFDGPGLRTLGNVPAGGSPPATTGLFKPLTTFPDASVKPPNVWVHHNLIYSHDGTFQIDQAKSTGGTCTGSELGAADQLWEDNVAYHLGGTALLLGGGRCQTTNSIFRRFQVPSGKGAAVLLLNADLVGGTGDGINTLRFDDFIIDATVADAGYPVVINPQNGPVANIEFNGFRITAPKWGAFSVLAGTAGVSNAIYLNDWITSQPRLASATTVLVDATTDFRLTSSDITGRGVNTSDLVGIGLTTTSPASSFTITNTTLRNIRSGYTGFVLGSVASGTITGNTLLRQSGTPKAAIFAVDPNGTHNVTMTGNDLTEAPTIDCANGQGNIVNSNTGTSTTCTP